VNSYEFNRLAKQYQSIIESIDLYRETLGKAQKEIVKLQTQITEVDKSLVQAWETKEMLEQQIRKVIQGDK
jgi:predicted  nucleic acid-binding Zn-ribbon protein